MEAKFGTTVAKVDLLQDQGLWLLSGLDGQVLGQFDGIVATDKNISSPRFTGLTRRLPPLGLFPIIFSVVFLLK